MRKPVIGVMGGGEGAPEHAIRDAYRLGELIAGQGWIVLTGGRNVGVMDAASEGAHRRGGLTIGVLPDADARRASQHLDVCIVTGMGEARNALKILSSDVVIACAGGAGTLSEVALAVKSRKPVILLNFEETHLFQHMSDARVRFAGTPEEALDMAQRLIADRTGRI